MSNVVTCRCGKSFSAQPRLAGKRVACPSCGSPIQIPVQPAAAPIVAPIPVTCRCGQMFRAEPHLAGQQVRCPSCQSALSIPHQDEAAVPSGNSSAPTSDWMNDPLFDSAAASAPAPNWPAQTMMPATHAAPKRKRIGWPQTAAAHWSQALHDDSTVKLAAITIVGIALTVALPFATVMSISHVMAARESGSWPTVKATITQSEVNRDRVKVGFIYKPKVAYEYSVDGTIYTGKKISYGDPSSKDESKAQAVAAKYAAGTAHDVHYDPDNPSESVLETGTHVITYLALLLPLFCLMGPPIAYTHGMAVYGRLS